MLSRNKATSCIRHSIYEHEKQLADKIMTDSKLFRHYVRSKTNTKTGISNLDLGNGFTTTSDQDIADTLNNYFATVFVDEQGEDLPEFKHRNYASAATSMDSERDDPVPHNYLR